VGRSVRWLASACVVATTVAACGLGLVGTDAPDGGADAAAELGVDGAVTPTSDASVTPIDDASATPDADASATPDADAGPPPPEWDCAGTKVSDCSQCATRPLRCVMCAADGGPNLWKTCVPPSTSCYGSFKPAGYDWCRCGNDPSRCKLPEQGCNPYDNGVCVTCGEQLTSGDPCKGGGSCNQALAKCQ